MPSKSNSPEEQDAANGARFASLVLSAIFVAVLVLLETISWFTEHGGTISIVSAALTIHDKPPSFDVDKHSLRLSIILLIWISVVGFIRLTKIRLSIFQKDKISRTSALLFVIVILGNFSIDEIFGEPIITAFMTEHGYSRCSVGDHHHGDGKSRTWFANFTLRSQDCRRYTGS